MAATLPVESLKIDQRPLHVPELDELKNGNEKKNRSLGLLGTNCYCI